MLFLPDMKPLHLIIALSLALSLASCKKDNSEQAAEPTYNPAVQTDLVDVAYGNHQRNRYNIYLPANRNVNTPVLFMIHGGAWVAGSKEDYLSLLPAIRTLFPEYAVVLVNYRLFNAAEATTRFPAQENDVKACVEHVLSRSSQYAIGQKLVLWGQSAGAHLAALYAYKYRGKPYTAAALIDIVGPTDMPALYQQAASDDVRGLLSQLIGDPVKDSALYNSSSPTHFVTALSCPTLILHGDADEIVPYQQAGLLRDRLQQAGVTHRYKLYPGEGHALQCATADATNEVIAFLRTHVQ